MLSSPQEEHSLWILFCDIFSISYSIMIFCLIIFMLITIIIKREFTITTTYSLHLALCVCLNAVSYILPDPEKEINKPFTDSLSCLIKADIHLCSLTLSVNLIFIYYLIAFLLIREWSKVQSLSFQIILYLINWFTIIFFIIFYSQLPTVINPLLTCRFQVILANWITIVNSAYSIILTIITCILFIFIIRTITHTDLYSNSPILFNHINNAIKLFIVVLLILFLKVLSFTLNRYFIVRVIDRVWENICFTLVFLLLGISLKTFREFCCCNSSEPVASSNLQKDLYCEIGLNDY